MAPMAPPPAARAPGWYRDPEDSADWRWWNGFEWVGQALPFNPVDVSEKDEKDPPAAVAAAVGAARFDRRRVLPLVALGVGAVVVVSAALAVLPRFTFDLPSPDNPAPVVDTPIPAEPSPEPVDIDPDRRAEQTVQDAPLAEPIPFPVPRAPSRRAPIAPAVPVEPAPPPVEPAPPAEPQPEVPTLPGIPPPPDAVVDPVPTEPGATETPAPVPTSPPIAPPSDAPPAGSAE